MGQRRAGGRHGRGQRPPASAVRKRDSRSAYELRTLAPVDVPVDVRLAADPVIAPTLGALALLQAPADTPEGQFFARHLVTREAYLKNGGSSSTPGERGGSALGDARFGDWNAVPS